MFIIIFSVFFFELGFLDFCLDWSNFPSAWYDNHFLFCSFFLFLVLMVCLFRATTHVIDDLPDWSITSYERIVLKRVGFWSKVVRTNSVQRKDHGSKVFQRNGQFWSTYLKALIKVISTYRDLRILCFWSSMGFDRLEAVASLDAYQITNYQFLSKTHHFLLPYFRIIREISFWIRNFKANCLSRRDQKVYSIFQNRAPI